MSSQLYSIISTTDTTSLRRKSGDQMSSLAEYRNCSGPLGQQRELALSCLLVRTKQITGHCMIGHMPGYRNYRYCKSCFDGE
ncbi:hypothetical protein FF38_06562 [Lucilia cuprina]|uniref:Uncharacterized protein n=1 Tax=Lucilia cuprina TaxID=7375 RepID=A0A0L0CAY6_LUCCU|nr:hypothetical protein FF38_06562 [Lucilia cuprina]